MRAEFERRRKDLGLGDVPNGERKANEIAANWAVRTLENKVSSKR